MESKFLTVTEVTARVKSLLQDDPILSDLKVEGEISNFHHHRSGHMYFSLKDDNSKLNCVMFQGNNQKLDFSPKDGQVVLARGYLDVYVPRGEYQLYVAEMEQEGEGALYQKFLKLKKKLKEEGLFDQDRKQELPFLPAKIGLVTSPTGAAIRDIISVLKRRYAGISVLLAPSRVQGEEAEKELIRSLEYLENREDIDLIIISRGGGSLEDLWPFNSEKLARKIAASDIPIISGVGHETDFTIADFVADLRAPTPSAAAELAVKDFTRLEKQLKELGRRLYSAYLSVITTNRRELKFLSQNRIWREPSVMFQNTRQQLDDLVSRFSRELEAEFRDKQQKVKSLARELENLSPHKILSRGYSITMSQQGEVIKKSSEVRNSEMITTRLANGEIDSQVINSREEQHD